MTQITTAIAEDCGLLGGAMLPHASLVACDHCGIVALDTPAFGWRRWYNAAGVLAHHCPAAVEYNTWVAEGRAHMRHPDEAIIYESVDHWIAEILGPEPEAATSD